MATEQESLANKDTSAGSFQREPTVFHHRIGSEAYPAASGRYRLYVAPACPWACRCWLTLTLKGLEGVVAVTLTGDRLANISFEPPWDAYHGWDFTAASEEPHGFAFIDELYEHASPGYRASHEDVGKRPCYSVPVLFCELTQSIVSTESAEIIEMLNSEFNALPETKRPLLDLSPPTLKQSIDSVNAIVYPSINDGVYRCGFATSQEAYESAYEAHWKGMDEVEELLSTQRFLCGDVLTLADVRLFPSLVRYDAVYYSHFKTSRSTLRHDMPNLHRFLRDVYRLPGVASTVRVERCKGHYYESQRMVNPSGVVPKGPDFEAFFADAIGLPPPYEL